MPALHLLDTHLINTHLLEKTPIALAGLAFGIASLGWLWESTLATGGYIQVSSALIAFAACALVVAKLMHRPQILKHALLDPVAGSVLPTIAMCWVIVSQSVAYISTTASLVMWSIALALHALLFIWFCLQRVRKFQFEQMMPAWFIPPIGLAVAAVANPSPHSEALSSAIVSFAIVCCLILLPIMLVRLLKGPTLADINKPTLALFAAPPNLCLVSYLQYSAEPSFWFVSLLLTLAVITTLFAYISFVRLYWREFTPVSAAFTFPTVIGSSAMYSVSDYFNTHSAETAAHTTHQLAQLQLLIATAVTLLVCTRYIKYFNTTRD
ncbi:MAG: TDT family transporter [Pseudomonadales bacterium]